MNRINDPNDPWKIIATLELEVHQLLQRYEMRNNDANARAEERAKIAEQLAKLGFKLLPNGEIVREANLSS